MTTTSATVIPDRSSRRLLIISLAINLFFVGTVGALAIRHYVTPARTAGIDRPRSVAARIDRLASLLPAADAETLRAAFHARATSAEGARDALNRAIERIQAGLRAQPFDPNQLRAAMADARALRPTYELEMQEILVAAAAAMSEEGRVKLADWPQPRSATNAR